MLGQRFVVRFGLLGLCLSATSCSDDAGAPTCDAGSTQACLCTGGASGVQVCAADGSRWLACDCGAADADADADADGDADAPDGETTCTDECPAVDATQCLGEVVWRCRSDPAGCREWTFDSDCAATERTCETSAGGATCVADGRCSQTGEPCTAVLACPEASLTGFCMLRGPTGWDCGYDNRFGAGETATCGGETLHRCDSDFECPSGAWCGEATAEACGEYFVGVCKQDGMPFGTCTAAESCVLTEANECVTCGNGAVEGPQEECDDGNAVAGDGCSDSCRREGVCVSGAGDDLPCDCASASDCDVCDPSCPGSACTCRIP